MNNVITKIVLEVAPETLGIVSAEIVIRGAQAYVFYKTVGRPAVFRKINNFSSKFKRKTDSSESLFIDSIDAVNDAF